MTAQEYLGQVQLKEQELIREQERIDTLRFYASGAGAIDYSADKVQTSPTGDRIAKIVTDLVDSEAALKQRWEDWENLRLGVLNNILNVENKTSRDILIMHFIEYLSFRIIADEMNYSIRHIQRLYKNALEDFEKLSCHVA